MNVEDFHLLKLGESMEGRFPEGANRRKEFDAPVARVHVEHLQSGWVPFHAHVTLVGGKRLTLDCSFKTPFYLPTHSDQLHEERTLWHEFAEKHELDEETLDFGFVVDLLKIEMLRATKIKVEKDVEIVVGDFDPDSWPRDLPRYEKSARATFQKLSKAVRQDLAALLFQNQERGRWLEGRA